MENSWEEYRYEVTECMLLHISHPQITCCSYQIDDANGSFEIAKVSKSKSLQHLYSALNHFRSDIQMGHQTDVCGRHRRCPNVVR